MSGEARDVPGVRVHDRSAWELGYRWPGEFEPVEAVWLAYPHNRGTWPGCFEAACGQYDHFMAQVARFARVELIGKRHAMPTNDAWVRDYGPIFMVGPRGELACHDFRFDGWGGKYDGSYADDDAIPRRVARLLDIPVWAHETVLEGGSIDGNGRGVVMTTEACLINAKRNADADRAGVEAMLRRALGAERVIWLPGGIAGDDTDGHVDDVARFIGPSKIAAVRAPCTHPDHAALRHNWAALESARDTDGNAFDLVELPAPEAVTYAYPPDHFAGGGRQPCPASYANFLIVNAAVLVPVFGQRADDAACDALAAAMPHHHIEPIPADRLVVGLGALHCLSMQQPRPDGADASG